MNALVAVSATQRAGVPDRCSTHPMALPTRSSPTYPLTRLCTKLGNDFLTFAATDLTVYRSLVANVVFDKAAHTLANHML
jgi:hypothetical protein